MRSEADQSQPQTVEDEIAELERRLEVAKARLAATKTAEETLLPLTPSSPILQTQSKGNPLPPHVPHQF